MNDYTLRVEGLGELKKNLDELVKKYPDRAGNLLRAEAELKKKCRERDAGRKQMLAKKVKSLLEK